MIDIGGNIRKIRESKRLSQKEVVTAIKMSAGQYSRIEGGKTEPAISSLERIAKALGVKLSDLFVTEQDLQDVNSQDTTIMEKVRLMDSLPDADKVTMFAMLDSFVGKKKLKDTLANILNDVN